MLSLNLTKGCIRFAAVVNSAMGQNARYVEVWSAALPEPVATRRSIDSKSNAVLRVIGVGERADCEDSSVPAGKALAVTKQNSRQKLVIFLRPPFPIF
jgi:hypothetical protein